MAKLTVFNGGLNEVIAPHLIQENEGVIHDNIDHFPGPLVPERDKKSVVPDAKQFGHRFTETGTWYWSDTPKSYVEFQERLYIGNRNGESTKIVGTEESKLGITPPTISPILAGTSYEIGDIATVAFTTIGALFAALGDLPNETNLEYRLITENSAGELSAGPEIFDITTGSYGPNAVLIRIADRNWTDDVHVYRKYTEVWRLVKTVAFDTAKDFDAQPAITDQIYDISGNAAINEGALTTVGKLTGALQYAFTYYNSTTGTESVPRLTTGGYANVINGKVEITDIQVSIDPQVDEKRIYRIGGDITAFHLVDTIDNTTTEYTDITADLDLTGELLQSDTNYPPPNNINWLTEAYAMLFASKKDKLLFTPIGQPESWPETYYLDFPANITGIGKTPVGLLVFTRYETFLVTGTGPLSLSQQLLTGSQGCVAGDSVVNIQGAAYWASTDGICISEGGRVIVYTRPKITKMILTGSINAVVHDQKYYILSEDLGTSYILDVEKKVLRTANYDIRSYIVANDQLYGYRNDALHKINGSNARLSMSYRSPSFIGAGLTVQKVYKNIYMYSEGEINLKVYINDLLVQEKDVTTTDNHQVKIPSENTRGFQIAFAITGTGTVYELRWDDGNANQ